MFTTLSITSLNQGNIFNCKPVISALQADFDAASARHQAQAMTAAPKANRTAFVTNVLQALANVLPSTGLVRRVGN